MEWEFIILNALQNIHKTILDNIMIFLSNIGEYGIVWIIFSFALFIKRKYRACAILVIIALLINYIECDIIIKNIIQRERPCVVNPIDMIVSIPKSYSFPSGHTSSSFAASTIIFLHNKKFGVTALILAILIAFSRMYLYVHFPTDIIGGIVFGILNALLVSFLYNKSIKNKLVQKTGD